MIKIRILYLFSLLAFAIPVQAQYTLEIEINGIRSDSGAIMLELMDSNKAILRQEMLPLKDRTCAFTLKDIAQGKYALRYFHDENSNGKLETSPIGKPVEGFGFSNNVPARFGLPPFEKQLFEVKENKKLSLNITY